MKTRYIDLIEQTFEWPQEEFRTENYELYFHNIPLMDIIKQYGTPLKITYLPKISQQINKAKRWFNIAFAKADYNAKYYYTYCTKSSYFSFVLDEALKNDIHLETSSAFDFPIIQELYEEGKITTEIYIICNGFKKPLYLQYICELINSGFKNTIPILDNPNEFNYYEKNVKAKAKIGIRIATEEEPGFNFYTSRLGFRYSDIIDFYKQKIKDNKKFELKILHFFINTGIKDTSYYWSELHKAVNLYIELKKICPELDSLNIGGGLPFKNSLAFNYDYEYIIEEIVFQIKKLCNQAEIPEPNIFTEFGQFTTAESGAIFFSVLDQKRQNDKELWDMIDGSFMTTMPDIWATNQRFILLPINHWDYPYERVFLGGITCDSHDYYSEESHINAIYLPKFDPNDTLYIGFFHTGAYQDTLSGYGGIQHCLIPAPKHVIINVDEEGDYYTKLFAKEQSYISMLKHLGYY